MNQLSLSIELARHTHLRSQLLADFPDLDDETLHDTLEGLTDLREMIAAILRSALADELLSGALAARIADMKARLDRIEAGAKRKRQAALRAMEQAGLTKILKPDFTASLRQAAPTLDILAEEKIPPAYWKPQPSKLDKQGILTALKAGAIVEGAVIAAPTSQLSVRTK